MAIRGPTGDANVLHLKDDRAERKGRFALVK
jgi:hypothetical protein